MTKFIKRICTLILCLAMVLPALCGCSSTAKPTGLFDTVKKAADLTNYKANAEITIEANDEKVSLELEEIGTKDASAINLSAKCGGFSFSLEDCFFITEDTVYIDIAEICDAIVPFLEMNSSDNTEAIESLEELAEKLGCVSITAEGAFKKDTTYMDKFLTAMDKAFSDIVEKEDGSYVLEIKDEEDITTAAKAVYNMLDENLDEWTTELAGSYEDRLNIYVNAIKDYADRIVDALGDKVLADYDVDLKDYMDQAMDSMEDTLDSVKDTDKNMDDFMDEFKDAIDYMEENEDFMNGSKVDLTITAGMEDSSYVTKIEGSVDYEGQTIYGLDDDLDFSYTEESYSYTVDGEMSVTPDSTVSVELPKDSKDIVDALSDNYDELSEIFGTGDSYEVDE